MRCPKCRKEYADKITRCADCGTMLTEAAEAVNPDRVSTDDANSDNVNSDSLKNLSGGSETNSHAYRSLKSKREDIKSTAYSFTIVSLLGILFLALFAAGLLPLNTPGYMKILICIVMGAMFAAFLAVGLKSFSQLKSLGEAADAEEKRFQEVTSWFTSSVSRDDVDSRITGDAESEQLYFCRYEIMEQIIRKKYPDLDEAFLDHIIESLYTGLF